MRTWLVTWRHRKGAWGEQECGTASEVWEVSNEKLAMRSVGFIVVEEFKDGLKAGEWRLK